MTARRHISGLASLQTEEDSRLAGTPAEGREKPDKKLFHLSDCVAPGDIAQQRLQIAYALLEQKLGQRFRVEFQGSTPGRSLHTGVQALQLIGQNAELARLYRTAEVPLYILVNNADRSKHAGAESAGGSDCYWATVTSAQSDVQHQVVGVDPAVFSPLKPWIRALRRVTGIPDDPAFADLSNGTQFRSLRYYTRVHAAVALHDGKSAGPFNAPEASLESIPDLEIEHDEGVLGDRDRFGNCKLLTAHDCGVDDICREIGATLDQSKVDAIFTDPDSGCELFTLQFVPTQYLGRHTGEQCVWNGSSRTPDLAPLVELGVSKSYPEQVVRALQHLKIGTRVRFQRA